MTKQRLALACALLLTCAHANAEDKKHDKGDKGSAPPARKVDPNASNYSCSITTYAEAKTGKEEHLRGPDYIKMNGPSDAVPAPGFETTGKDGKKSTWKITRVPSTPPRVLVQFTGPNGEDNISSTVDGAPIYMQIPGSKYILTCKPPKDAFDKMCGNGDKGDDVKPDAGRYGVYETIEQIKPNAGAYGEMAFIRPDAGAYGRTLRALPDAGAYGSTITAMPDAGAYGSTRTRIRNNPNIATYRMLRDLGALDILEKASPELYKKLMESLLSK